ncbi:triphosphatase [Oxalobacteraceae bacterium GrIS 1.11]
MEIELKLLLDPAAKARLLRHRLLIRHAVGKPERAKTLAVYFDTPEFDLLRHRAGLRVRESAGAWRQTMKAGGGALAGLHQRHEWEGPVDGALPDLPRLRHMVGSHSPWTAMLAAPALAERLRPQFTVRVTRSTWQLEVDGDAIELVLDEGTLEREGVRLPICEIELELVSGRPERLYALALELLADLPLRLDHGNKAERGYALCLPPASRARKARPFELARRTSVEAGVQTILGNCLAQIQDNEAGTLQGRDAEYLHQMRVGLRRLRCALTLFDAVAPCPATLQGEIDWLGGVLGAARDWDVLSNSTAAMLGAAPGGEQQLALLKPLLGAMVEQHHAQVAQALLSPRYAALLLNLGGWLLGARWRDGADPAITRQLDSPLRQFADDTMTRGQRRLLKRGRGIADADAQGLHRLRIAVKKNHYAAQFFNAFYRPKQVKAYIAALAALQDQLGWRNDVAVADGLLRQLPQTEPADAAATGFARGYLLARLDQGRQPLREAWRAVRALTLPGAA